MSLLSLLGCGERVDDVGSVRVVDGCTWSGGVQAGTGGYREGRVVRAVLPASSSRAVKN